MTWWVLRVADRMLFVEMKSWAHCGADRIEAAARGDTRIVALDRITAALLGARGVPYRSLEACQPDRDWMATNAIIWDLLRLQAAETDAAGLLDHFSHYLIFEVNLIFDRFCRIREIVEQEKPGVVTFAGGPGSELTEALYAVASGLNWTPQLHYQQWS